MAKRPYITVGFTAFVLLIPLAVTSTNKMVQRLGNNWRRLHSLIYPCAVLVIFHYLWLVKADILPPVIYGLILCLLLVLRSPRLRPSKRAGIEAHVTMPCNELSRTPAARGRPMKHRKTVAGE